MSHSQLPGFGKGTIVLESVNNEGNWVKARQGLSVLAWQFFSEPKVLQNKKMILKN